MPPALDVNDAAAPWPDLESPRVPATPKAPRRRFRQRIKSLPYSLSLLAAVGLVFFVYKHIAGGAWDTEASAQEAAARRLNGMDERINAGDYPNEIFSAEDLKSGAIVLHFLGMIYMFIAVSFACCCPFLRHSSQPCPSYYPFFSLALPVHFPPFFLSLPLCVMNSLVSDTCPHC